MTQQEFEQFFPSFFRSLFELWIARNHFPDNCNLANEQGMNQIYQYPITDSIPEKNGGTQQPRGQNAVEQQQNHFILHNGLQVLISPDGYVVVNLSNEANLQEIRYMGIKVITQDENPKLKVTSLNYPDQNNKYRSGCSARDLLRFIQKTKPNVIPQRWQDAGEDTAKNYMNAEFLNSGRYRANDRYRALHPNLITKEKRELSRNENHDFYFPLFNNLANENDIEQNIDEYNKIQFGKIYYVERPDLETQAIEYLFQRKAIRMSTPKGMGKTMLLNHHIIPNIPNDYQVVICNCNEARQSLNDYSDFSKWFLSKISIQTISGTINNPNLEQITNDVNNEINTRLGENVTNPEISNFLREYLLLQIPVGLIIVFEKFDLILQLGIFDNSFVPLLRDWWIYSDNNMNIWNKLHLILLNSSEVYARNGDDYSPDIGIRLDEFRGFRGEINQENNDLQGEIINFINMQELGFELNQPQILEMINLIAKLPYQQLPENTPLIDASPYLLSEFLNRLRYRVNIEGGQNDIIQQNFDQILAQATTLNGVYRQHFNELLAILANDDDLRIYLTKIVHSDSPVNMQPPFHFRLESLGIISIFSNNQVGVKNKLYKDFYSSIYTQN
ncbi:AAA-like domain-containing protein [Geminocystis sp. GBBB08]|uniref:AAA-like domain-containing protein n=1 Tax=Geminocystis sp. GBBB08 TaxID=2604140 RepID=UPI0027E30559|nr:AAA-like domain-containing protein [Geminocystis sp. GBBB08]MBL1211651.1 hypothetical protein [Geminocystis sp. GBBB08]